jgi:hypothetical protein
MIQNALGTFDEQMNQPEDVAQEQAQPKPAIKLNLERLDFANSPFYVVRAMSLPLLAGLVSITSTLYA